MIALRGRKPHLDPQRAAEVRRRWAIYEANKPAVLEREYGISANVLRRYARDRIKGVMER